MNPVFETILYFVWVLAIPAIAFHGPRTKLWKKNGVAIRGWLTAAWVCLIIGLFIVHPMVRF